MVNLNEYLVDGAKMQESCVMAYLRSNYDHILNEAYNKELVSRYEAELGITRYYNCREQGYTVSLSYHYYPVVNITFFEHRNSDQICVLVNKDKMFSECPTPDEVWGDRKNKYDYDKNFDYMQIQECGDYIVNILRNELHRVIEEKHLIDEYKKTHDVPVRMTKEIRQSILAEMRNTDSSNNMNE